MPKNKSTKDSAPITMAVVNVIFLSGSSILNPKSYINSNNSCDAYFTPQDMKVGSKTEVQGNGIFLNFFTHNPYLIAASNLMVK